ncbi:MAG: hypothetical protein M0P13_03355 [Fibrobacteraceae bacterium]|nr:hypothetical protein [Fibrobacteraceae bacterium]
MKLVPILVFFALAFSFGDSLRWDSGCRDNPWREEIHIKKHLKLKSIKINGVEVNSDSVSNREVVSPGLFSTASLMSLYYLKISDEVANDKGSLIKSFTLESPSIGSGSMGSFTRTE